MQRQVSPGHVVRRTVDRSLAYEERQLLRIWRMYDGGGRRALRAGLLLPPRVVFQYPETVLRCQERRLYWIMVHV